MSHFYVTLPSNTRIDGNHSNNFMVSLPHPLHLEGDWEVALVEMIYPFSWNNMQATQDADGRQGNVLDFQFVNGDHLEITIPESNYEKIGDLLHTITIIVENNGEKVRRLQSQITNVIPDDPRLYIGPKDGTWDFDILTKRVHYRRPTSIIQHVMLSKPLQYLMGFQDQKLSSKLNVAQFPVDIRAGIDTLYVYCSIIENQIVGDTKVKLLRSVNVTKGAYGELVEKVFYTTHYVPVLNQEIESIAVEIKGTTGTLIPFQFGNTMLKLHFRLRKPY